MTERLLVTTRTTPTMLDFARALLTVMPDASKEIAGVLWAHFAGETGSGQYCWNWNLGNVKHVKGDGSDYISLRGVWEGFKITDEDHDGGVDEDDKIILRTRLLRSGMWVEDPSSDHAIAVGNTKISMIATAENSASWFRAYPDLATGMHSFVSSKQNEKSRYHPAWTFVLAGDPEGYGRKLGALGYYTASSDAYARSMRARFNQWMSSNAFDEAIEAGIEIDPEPVTPSAVVSSPEHALAYTTNELVEVELDGVVWLVSPIYIAPIGIGQAVTLASNLGYELPTPALVDAIWRAADLKVPPHLMVRKHDGVHMNTPELQAEEARVLEAYVGPRALGTDFHLIAGPFKDVVMMNGVPGIYGWHADTEAALKLKALGVPVHAPVTPGEGVVIQQPYTAHALGWVDFSQALRLVRRKTEG